SPRPRRGPRLSRPLVYWLLLVLLGVVSVKLVQDLNPGKAKPLSLAELYEHWDNSLRDGKGGFRGFTKAKAEDNVIHLWMERSSEGRAAQEDKQVQEYKVKLPPNAISQEELLAKLSTIPGFEYENSNQVLLSLLAWFGPWVLLIGLIW